MANSPTTLHNNTYMCGKKKKSAYKMNHFHSLKLILIFTLITFMYKYL